MIERLTIQVDPVLRQERKAGDCRDVLVTAAEQGADVAAGWPAAADDDHFETFAAPARAVPLDRRRGQPIAVKDGVIVLVSLLRPGEGDHVPADIRVGLHLA